MCLVIVCVHILETCIVYRWFSYRACIYANIHEHNLGGPVLVTQSGRNTFHCTVYLSCILPVPSRWWRLYVSSKWKRKFHEKYYVQIYKSRKLKKKNQLIWAKRWWKGRWWQTLVMAGLWGILKNHILCQISHDLQLSFNHSNQLLEFQRVRGERVIVHFENVLIVQAIPLKKTLLHSIEWAEICNFQISVWNRLWRSFT